MQDGDVDAVFNIDVEWLWSQAKAQVEGIFRRAGIPPEDAEDLLQSIFLRMLTVDYEITAPVAWLVSSVRFSVLAFWRAKRAHTLQQLDGVIADRLSTPPDDSVERCDLERCLAELSEQCRDVIRQRYQLGESPTETSRRLGYTTRGVRNLTRKCLDRLADRLLKGGYEPTKKPE